MGKKKFIDKKKAVTFHLVHRSQHDPLYVDESAPQHVLVQADSPGNSKSVNKSNDPQKQKVEQRKFGVFFDDDYNYLQHLRAPGNESVEWQQVEKIVPAPVESTSKIKLPSSVFPSEFEEDEGLLRRGAITVGPRPDWDPDIVAALDDDFDYDDPDNILDDDFMKLATGDTEEGQFDENEMDDIDSNFSDEEDDYLGPMRNDDFNGEENKSRFTEYSMSSSVIRRNAQLTLLDDRFEKFFDNYNESEIGALDCDEIEGHVEADDQLLLNYATEFKKDQCETYDKNWDIVRLVKSQEHDKETDNEELVEMVVDDDKSKKWDCESVLSNYSNIYNHPKVIDEPKRNKIKINQRTGIPEDTLHSDTGKLTAKSLAKLQKSTRQNAYDSSDEDENEDGRTFGGKSLCDQSVISTLSVLSIRPKNETKDERQERKKLLKEYRAERRIEKKANTLAFKEEKVMQEKVRANNRLNVQGKKLY